MGLAIREAQLALEHGDVPVGALVVVDEEVIASAHNERELTQDPTAHAEVVAMRAASQKLNSWRVLNSTLYVTLEPCTMCAGAVVLARIPRVVYGTADPKAGACGSTINILNHSVLNHRPEVKGGVLQEECSSLLKAFFISRR